MEYELANQTIFLLEKDLDCPLNLMDPSRESILNFLKQFIAELLDKNLERLFYVMYRLDIPEEKVLKCLSPNNPEAPVDQLAAMVMEREVQKARARLENAERYKDDPGDGWNL